MIPTTEEFFKKYSDNTSLSEGHYDYLVEKDSFKEAMIEFAKLHVEAALNAAYSTGEYWVPGIDEVKEDILSSYPLENIK
jgi:hypothetical protein